MKKISQRKPKKAKDRLLNNQAGQVGSKRSPRPAGLGIRFNRAINKGLMVMSRSLTRWAQRKN